MSSPSRMVVVGQFAGTHGVRGAFKIRSFTDDPADVASYGPVTTKDGRVLNISLVREMKPGLFLVTAPEITSPEAGDAFKGELLHVLRENLPQTDEDEFYLDDLVGLSAITETGDPAGKVKAVVNFGAGDILELYDVPDRKGTILIPFTREDVPVIDMGARQITVLLPEDTPAKPEGDVG